MSHWSIRKLSGFLSRTENISVSHNYIATLCLEHGLKPWRVGTFKLSRDPAFAEKVADIVGLYLEPPGGAVVLSIDGTVNGGQALSAADGCKLPRNQVQLAGCRCRVRARYLGDGSPQLRAGEPDVH